MFEERGSVAPFQKESFLILPGLMCDARPGFHLVNGLLIPTKHDGFDSSFSIDERDAESQG